MTYNIIASGSDGNATIINGVVLIDCGVPMVKLRPYAKDLKLVLLTHSHGDHFNTSTVRSLARMRPSLRWACCPWMVEKLIAANVSERVIDVFELGHGGWYNGIGSVMPQQIPHNVPNCCWKFEDGQESLFYATDCGSLDGVEAKDYDLYLVESNHSRIDLEIRAREKEQAGEYAYEIKAAENHLSHEQAIDWLAKNMGPRSLWIPMHQHRNKERSENNGQNQGNA